MALPVRFLDGDLLLVADGEPTDVNRGRRL
jgi:hypothetical protein